MKILVFGGRDFSNQILAFDVLDHLDQRFGITEIIHGDAEGADRCGDLWAMDSRKVGTAYAARWGDMTAPGAVIKVGRTGKPYNARAGFDRNQQMIDEGKPDMGLQFPGGSGTADMRRRLDKAGIPVIQVYEQPSGPLDWNAINAAADLARRKGIRAP